MAAKFKFVQSAANACPLIDEEINLNVLLKTIQLLSAAILAALVGGAVFYGINAAPAILKGEDFLLVSLYFTIPIGGVVGGFAFFLTFAVLQKWLGKKRDSRGNAIFGMRSFISVVVVCCAVVLITYLKAPRTTELAWIENVSLFSDKEFMVRRVQVFEHSGFRQVEPSDKQLKINRLVFSPSQGNHDVKVETELLPIYLGFIHGNWYLVLGPRPGGYVKESVASIEVEKWGKDFNNQAQRLSILSGNQFVPVNWSMCPDGIFVSNLLTPSVATFRDLNSLKESPVGHLEVSRRIKEFMNSHLDIAEIYIGRPGNLSQKAYQQARAAFL